MTKTPKWDSKWEKFGFYALIVIVVLQIPLTIAFAVHREWQNFAISILFTGIFLEYASDLLPDEKDQ
ncbi:MAG: hypothetical protein SPI12_06285 [Actinomycetaceae bacterium]|nr:hypothetical protein [Actinomycetaceae bacterium]MDY6083445.1 hypothetical protein [Actinomycetaceae bacterium]